MSDAHIHRAAIGVALVIILMAGAFLVDGWSLKPGVFEPIGSGTVPNAIAVIAIGLGAAVLAEALAGLRRDRGEAVTQEFWGPTLGVFVWTILYVLVLSSGSVRYQWATLIYLPVAILIPAQDRPRALPWAAGLGLVFAFGLDFVFRRILVADIP